MFIQSMAHDLFNKILFSIKQKQNVSQTEEEYKPLTYEFIQHTKWPDDNTN